MKYLAFGIASMVFATATAGDVGYGSNDYKAPANNYGKSDKRSANNYGKSDRRPANNYGKSDKRYESKSKPTTTQCPEFSSYQAWSKKCICWNGYVDDNYGGCKAKCSQGWQLDYKTQTYCEKICPWNNYYDRHSYECVPCPQNSLWEPSWNQCRCYGGYEKVHGLCILAGTHKPQAKSYHQVKSSKHQAKTDRYQAKTDGYRRNDNSGYENSGKSDAYGRNDNRGYEKSGSDGYRRNDNSGYENSGSDGYRRNDNSGYENSGSDGYRRNDNSGYEKSGSDGYRRNDNSGNRWKNDDQGYGNRGGYGFDASKDNYGNQW